MKGNIRIALESTPYIVNNQMIDTMGLTSFIDYLFRHQDEIKKVTEQPLETYLAVAFVDNLDLTGLYNSNRLAGIYAVPNALASALNRFVPFDGDAFRDAINKYAKLRSDMTRPNPCYQDIQKFINICNGVQYRGTMEDNKMILSLLVLFRASLKSWSIYELGEIS